MLSWFSGSFLPSVCFRIYFYFLFFNFYNVVLVSAVQQHKLYGCTTTAVIIHISPLPPVLPPHPITEFQSGLPVLYSNVPPAIHFTHDSIYIYIDATSQPLKKKFGSVLVRCIYLEPAIQSKVSQKEKNRYHILMHIYEI